jgi:hypothetical protein
MSENVNDKTNEIKGPESKLVILGFIRSGLRMVNRLVNEIAGGVPRQAHV